MSALAKLTTRQSTSPGDGLTTLSAISWAFIPVFIMALHIARRDELVCVSNPVAVAVKEISDARTFRFRDQRLVSPWLASTLPSGLVMTLGGHRHVKGLGISVIVATNKFLFFDRNLHRSPP